MPRTTVAVLRAGGPCSKLRDSSVRDPEGAAMSQHQYEHEAESRCEEHADALILEALLDKDAQRPWTVAEIARAFDFSEENASDSVGRLARAGLVHRLHGFVFASRTAVRTSTLSKHV
jgi:DNA-binding MarR family transcriptional regulator